MTTDNTDNDINEQGAPDEPMAPADEAGAMGPEGVAEVPDELGRIAAERDDYLDQLQRTRADFDNYRKRAARDQESLVARAHERLVGTLLPVLDACEAAFVQHPAEVEPLFNLLLGTLRKVGLEGMNLLEQPFDPNLADAVMHEPGDGGEPVVSEVLRSGYTWQGKVLRPAMVKVRG